MTIKTAGFIGIGNMGRPMAANLVKGGYQVLAYDVDTDRAAHDSVADLCIVPMQDVLSLGSDARHIRHVVGIEATAIAGCGAMFPITGIW